MQNVTSSIQPPGPTANHTVSNLIDAAFVTAKVDNVRKVLGNKLDEILARQDRMENNQKVTTLFLLGWNSI